MYSKVESEPKNTTSPPFTEFLNLEKEWPFLFWGTLITVPLHSTLAVNNLGLKLVS